MIRLAEISSDAPKGLEKEDIEEEFDQITDRIAELSEVMYAQKKHSLLVVLQGMDSSGKDGTTEKVFRKCSPAICSAYSFKKPTTIEFAHDFLWRVHQQVPPKGQIKIFIRSHYEDILIQRVHKWIDEERVSARMNAINAFEKLLKEDNNTTVLKFYMHLSYERQGEKLQERIDEPKKNWKHNPQDWEERKLWDQYIAAYEDAINRSEIPWIIAPVDQRWYRNYFVAKKVLEVLESMDLELPKLADEEGQN